MLGIEQYFILLEGYAFSYYLNCAYNDGNNSVLLL